MASFTGRLINVAVGAVAITSMGIGTAAATDVPLQGPPAAGPGYYGNPPPVEAYPPPPAYAYPVPPAVAVVPGPYYYPGRYYGGPWGYGPYRGYAFRGGYRR